MQRNKLPLVQRPTVLILIPQVAQVSKFDQKRSDSINFKMHQKYQFLNNVKQKLKYLCKCKALYPGKSWLGLSREAGVKI